MWVAWAPINPNTLLRCISNLKYNGWRWRDIRFGAIFPNNSYCCSWTEHIAKFRGTQVGALVGAQMGTQVGALVGALGTLGNTGGCIQRLILICRSTKSPPPLIFFFISFASGFLQIGANYEKIRNSLTAQDHLIWFILVVRHKECLKLKVVINQTIWSYTSNSFTERTKEIWFCGFSLKTYCDCGKLLRWRKIHHVFTQEQILGYTYQLYVWKCFIQLHLL